MTTMTTNPATVDPKEEAQRLLAVCDIVQKSSNRYRSHHRRLVVEQEKNEDEVEFSANEDDDEQSEQGEKDEESVVSMSEEEVNEEEGEESPNSIKNESSPSSPTSSSLRKGSSSPKKGPSPKKVEKDSDEEDDPDTRYRDLEVKFLEICWKFDNLQETHEKQVLELRTELAKSKAEADNLKFENEALRRGQCPNCCGSSSSQTNQKHQKDQEPIHKRQQSFTSSFTSLSPFLKLGLENEVSDMNETVASSGSSIASAERVNKHKTFRPFFQSNNNNNSKRSSSLTASTTTAATSATIESKMQQRSSSEKDENDDNSHAGHESSGEEMIVMTGPKTKNLSPSSPRAGMTQYNSTSNVYADVVDEDNDKDEEYIVDVDPLLHRYLN